MVIILITSSNAYDIMAHGGGNIKKSSELHINDFQSISMIESNLLPSKNTCLECK